MTSTNLIETLKRLGYPKVHEIDPHALDWAFESEKTRPFLDWLCHSVTEQNLLTQEEVEGYKQLQESGNVVHGSHLDEVLSPVSFFKLLPESESVQSCVDQLSRSLERSKEKRTTLMKNNKKLDLKQFSINSKISKMEKLMEEEKKSYRNAVEKCHRQSSKISETLERLTCSVKRLIALYGVDSTNKTHAEESGKKSKLIFLSQVSLKEYHEAEEQFSRDLTAFTKKRFFEGMVDMSGQRDYTDYDIVDITTLGNASSSQTEKDAFVEDCQEFSLLQQIFPQSEVDRVNALVNVKKAMSAVHEAKSILRHLKSGQFPVTASEISHSQKNAEENIMKTEADTADLVLALTDHIKQLGGLQGTDILTGDYDLKLKRQEYFTRSQDKLIDYLLQQRSRNEFLTMLYELELKFHQEIHHLLSAVEQMLQKPLEEWQQRITDLDDPDLNVAKLERGVVDTRDVSTSRCYQMMESSPESDHKHLYLPVTKMKDCSEKFHSTCENAKKSDEAMKTQNWNRMLELEDCVDKCEALLYHGSSTSSGPPSLSPANVQAAISSLKSAVSSLMTDVESVIADVNMKKKSLKGNLFQDKERELFSLFHAKPDRLRTIVDGLAEKLQMLERAND